MEYWLKRGYKLEGTKKDGVFVVHNSQKAGVLVTDFWGDLKMASPWFGSVERAKAEVAFV